MKKEKLIDLMDSVGARAVSITPIGYRKNGETEHMGEISVAIATTCAYFVAIADGDIRPQSSTTEDVVAIVEAVIEAIQEDGDSLPCMQAEGEDAVCRIMRKIGGKKDA